MPRDRFGASNIGTFACCTFPRDTKASKRANLGSENSGEYAFKQIELELNLIYDA
jgi:hypothetical protein